MLYSMQPHTPPSAGHEAKFKHTQGTTKMEGVFTMANLRGSLSHFWGLIGLYMRILCNDLNVYKKEIQPGFWSLLKLT